MYNFNEWVDRSNTISVKQAFRKENGLKDDVIALFVADMDFRSPKEVRDVIRDAADLGIFGYAGDKENYYDALKKWNKERHRFDVKKEWVLRTPGVVCALAFSVNAFTNPGDGVLIMQPVYPPFAKVIEQNDRKPVKHQLFIGEDGRYHIDFEKLEKQLAEENTKLMLLCSPHNPGGRVWSREELLKIGELCLRYHVLVAVDEIHYDFILSGHEHHVMASLSDEIANNLIMCTAPSKTFNLAGLQLSNIIIPNEVIRERYRKEMDRYSVSAHNMLSIEACRVAYESGELWLDELIPYLEGNIALVRETMERLPKIRMMEPDATYLVWLDFSAYGIENAELDRILKEEAGLWLTAGAGFGDGAEGFMRLNVGCPRFVLKEAMKRLEKTFSGR